MAKQTSVSTSFWKDALDSARQGVWDYDIRTGERNHSETWREIRGLRPGVSEPASDDDWLKVIHPDDRDLATDQTQKLNAGQLAEVTYEYRERHADGHWIWIMCRGRPIAWDKDGKPYRFLGTDTDISRIKASEEQIKSVSRQLELALSSVQIGIWRFDINRDTTDWDVRLRQIYGLPADTSPLPRDVWERALHPDDRDAAVRLTQQALAEGKDYEQSFRILRPDGATRFIQSRVSYQEDLIAGPILVGINWDATEEHEHSAALEQANQLATARNLALEAARAAMEHNALHDALTGLPNRRKLDQVQRQCMDAGTAGGRYAILLVDLDRFKQINDVFGHDVGDFVLKNTAEILTDCAGTQALVARVGGDEFAIFVPNSPADDGLARMAGRLIHKISQPVHYQGSKCRYGASIGIAVTEGNQLDGKALFINADLALYRAKNEGRGRYRFFTSAMRGFSMANKRMSDEILAGIERDEFTCVYQPQFHAKTQTISGVEALVRWTSPHLGTLLPQAFLTTAEDLDVLGTIDQIVLCKAAADFRRWTDMGLDVPRLSVNLSKARLRDPSLAEELAALDLDHSKLSFELLESNFLDETSDIVAENLDCFRRLGIGIEVDDFGTGHASIVSLIKLKPDRLKIDKALVGLIASSESQAQILKSIVEIGHLLGISIIAEGVESAWQIQRLQEVGCDELQGFALAKPLTSDELIRFLQK